MIRVSDVIRGARLAGLSAAIALGAALSGGPAGAAEPPVAQMKTFKDWMVGCNNVRSCMAFGFSADHSNAYVSLKRDGAAEAPVELAVSARFDSPAEPLVAPVMSLSISGAPVAGLSKSDWPADVDAADSQGISALLRLRGADVAALLKAMHSADALDISITDAKGQNLEARISLSGAMAALLYMDELQHRNGTVTALAASGPAPASSVPSPPAMPRLEPVIIRPVAHPPAALPQGVRPAPAEDCGGTHPHPPEVMQLGPHLQLWAVCEFANAHNFSRRYWLVGPDGAREAALSVPGHPDDGGSPSVLVNLSLSQDGRLLEAFTRGRGISDCGSKTGWAWTGTAFQLAYFSEMPDCRGVPADHWPSLYVTKWE